MGEVLRASNAKRLVHAHAPKLRQTLVGTRQLGILLPGGFESLIHWRSTVEQAARDGTMDPIVVSDLDMKNYYNTVEWSAIRASLRTHFAEASPPVEWEQQQPGVTYLRDGSVLEFSRGAEQDEPLGPINSALPLGDAIGPLREG